MKLLVSMLLFMVSFIGLQAQRHHNYDNRHAHEQRLDHMKFKSPHKKYKQRGKHLHHKHFKNKKRRHMKGDYITPRERRHIQRHRRVVF